MIDWLSLTQSELIALILICFLAGVVRGFSGFALSALVMASAVLFLAPVELIPILWFLEMSASLLMARGGWKDADRKAALTLVLGNMVGWPVGLSLTTNISITASKNTALVIVLVLAATQLAKLRLSFLATNWGTALTGVIAGVVSGLAHVGGMIVALYALSRDADARTMRGTLVTFLFLASIGSLFFQIGFGVMDKTSIARAAILVPPTIFGVWLGQKTFNDKWQKYYRPFCLWLLIALAGFALVRQILSF